MRFFEDAKKEVFRFSLAIHRVTELFPEREPLRVRLREYAIEAVARVNACEFAGRGQSAALFREILSNLGALRDFILISHETGFMAGINAEVLRRECSVLDVYFRHELAFFQNGILHKDNVVSGGEEKAVLKSDEKADLYEHKEKATQLKDTGVSINDIIGQSDKTLNERRVAIIDYLRDHKEAKIAELAGIFSNRFSLKTLQRDLARLIFDQKVMREGDKRWAVYRMK